VSDNTSDTIECGDSVSSAEADSMLVGCEICGIEWQRIPLPFVREGTGGSDGVIGMSCQDVTTMYRPQLHPRHVPTPPNNLTCRFFFHEHARKIGIWAWAFVISPYLGPFLSAIISNYKPWRTSFWIDFLIVGLAVVFVTFLGDETLSNSESSFGL
jgi:hypothetical protein